jgi:hypothetical protein
MLNKTNMTPKFQTLISVTVNIHKKEGMEGSYWIYVFMVRLHINFMCISPMIHWLLQVIKLCAVTTAKATKC